MPGGGPGHCWITGQQPGRWWMQSGGELGQAGTHQVPLYLSITASEDGNPQDVWTVPLSASKSYLCSHFDQLHLAIIQEEVWETVSSLTRYTAQTTTCSIIHAVNAHSIAGLGQGLSVSF